MSTSAQERGKSLRRAIRQRGDDVGGFNADIRSAVESIDAKTEKMKVLSKVSFRRWISNHSVFDVFEL